MTEFEVFASKEREGWAVDEIVDAYVRKFGPITDVTARLMTEREGGPERRILDLCCGQGALTAMLCESGASVSGLDFSQKMLELASEAAPNASFHRGDAADLPYPDESFDAVLCNFGMMHLPDQPRALKEIRRVLKPSGRFIMATWAAPDVSPAFGIAFSAIKSNADLSRAPAQPDSFAFADPSVSEQMLSKAGLKMTNHEFVKTAWEIDRPEELFEIFLGATVSASMLIRSQSKDRIKNIKAYMTEKVASEFQAEAGFEVPVSIAVVTAE